MDVSRLALLYMTQGIWESADLRGVAVGKQILVGPCSVPKVPSTSSFLHDLESCITSETSIHLFSFSWGLAISQALYTMSHSKTSPCEN